MRTLNELTKLGTTAHIYVGADNVKNVVDRQTVYNYIASKYDGATFQDGLGVYKSEFEDSLTVIIVSNDVDKLINTCQELKTLLQQESVGLEYNNQFYLVF